MPSKKRKRETVDVEHPRITYDAPSREFDRLFKEGSLEEMKDVVRKKLGVATSVPIFLSRVGHGRSVDLEDDDDFDAFRVFVHASQVTRVKVVVGSDTPSQPLPNGDSEFLSSSEKKKKKKKKSNATVQSPVASSSALVDSPPQKKRRVSFVELPGDQPEENAAVVPATPEKKKHKSVAGSSEPGNEAPFDTSSRGVTNEGTEKKKKKKKTSATVSEELALPRTEDGAETIPEAPPAKKAKKRTREEDSEIISSSRLQETDSLADKEDDTSRPEKKLKKKRGQTVNEPETPQISRSKSVPPPSSRQKDILVPPAVPSGEPESPIKSKKTRKKGKDRGVSEPPSAVAPSSPELIRHEEASNEKKSKGKSKAKVDEPSSLDTPRTTGAKATEVKKNKVNLAQQKETPPRDASTLDETTKKTDKVAEGSRATLPITPKDTVLDEPSSPVETKTPKTRRKSQDAGTSKASRLRTAAEKSRDSGKSQISEELREAALAAIQAILSRKGVTASATSNAQARGPQTSVQAAASLPPSSDGEEELPVEEETQLPCPLCDELPTHDRPLCPVIKGGVRAMRKRVTQLQKDTSGDEKKQEERGRVIEELQAIIQKRSRKSKTSNAATNGSVQVEKANGDPLSATPAPVAAATKPAKQVDVVSPPTRVVDVVPSIASSKPVKSLSSNAKSLKLAKQSSQPPPASQQPSTSQKSVATTTQDTENLMANLPLVGDPSSFGLGDLPFEDLSQFTDNDLQSIIHGRKVSIADMPSSDEDEEEQDEEEEEPFLDEDEPQPKTPRRLSQGSSRVDYASSSDAEEEDENSAEGSVSNAGGPSLFTEGEDQTDDRQTSEGPLGFGDGDTSFREVDTRGSSREVDRTGDDAFDAALAEDFATLDAVLPVNGKPKTTEDSDTAVGSQVEELADLQAKGKKVESTKAVTTIEPSDEREELIVSDDDHPALLKVESIIRTRSQKRQVSEQQEDSVQAPKAVKKARKITELPVPSLSSARVVKSASTSNTSARRIKTAVQQDHEAKGSDGGEDADDPPPRSSTKVGSKATSKDTKRSTNTRSKAATSETSKGKASTKAGSRVSAAAKKITLTEPMGLADAINRTSDGDNIFGSQWAVLHESNPLTETPGQVDELISEFATPAPLIMRRNRDAGASRDPLFLPSATPYSQTFSSQRRNGTHEPSHESDDEKEVLATVVKPAKPLRTYRSLSQIASSQTFAAPRFQPADFGRSQEPDSLYGSRRRDSVESESESSAESDKSPVASHIPASRRAGVLKK